MAKREKGSKRYDVDNQALITIALLWSIPSSNENGAKNAVSGACF